MDSRDALAGPKQLVAERSKNLGYDLQRVGLLAWIGDDLLNPRGTPFFRSQLRYRLEGAEVSNVSPDLQAQGIEPSTDRIGSLTPSWCGTSATTASTPAGAASTRCPGNGSRGPRRERRVHEGRVLDELVLLVASAHRVRDLGTAGAGHPVRRDTEPADPGPFLHGRQHERTRVSENQLGPRDAAGNPLGGEALAVLSLEWRFPLWRWLGGAVFVDAGTVTPEVGDLSFSAFKSGAGAGLRVATPVGPIRFDAAYALQPIQGEDRFQVYLTVGFPF